MEIVKECQRCPLRNKCNQVVSGAGPLNAKIFILNKYPGVDEDIIGEPLMGLSGKYLDKILKSADISREGIYITNAVKCKPPYATPPAKEEIQSCKYWLWEELKLIKPKFIVSLGTLPFLLLTKKKNVILKDFIGKDYKLSYIDSLLIPWYDMDYLLQRGKSWEIQTVDFFKNIKERI